MSFTHIKPGDIVTRMLAGVLPMQLRVTEVKDGIIYCGPQPDWWMFDAETGAEIDHVLEWGPDYGVTGSYLVPGDS